MPRRDIVGGAAPTTLSTSILSGDTAAALASSSGWPAGVSGPFYIRIYSRDADGTVSSLEKILVTSRSGLNLALGTRGADGTTAQAHPAGSIIEHIGTAVDLDEANAHIYDIARNDHTQYMRKADAPGNGLALNGSALDVTVDGVGIQIAADTLSLKDGGVTGPKLIDGAVSTAKLVDNAVTSAKIAANTIVAADIAANTITATEIAANAITNSELADGAVDTLATFGSLVRPVQICSSSTRPGGPSVGDRIFELDTGAELTYQSATTGWTPPWNTAWGQLKYVQVTASQTGITSGVDLTSLTTGSITYVANRSIRISGEIAALCSVSGAFARLDLVETSTVLGSDQQTLTTSNTGMRTAIRVSPSAGAHTYKLQFGKTAGTGTVDMVASATDPAWIMVEDCGPVPGFPPV